MGMGRLELVVLLLVAACSDDRHRDGDAGVDLDAQPFNDAQQMDAGTNSSDSGPLPDGGMGIVEGGINLEGGGPPPGRVRCYFGKNYNCTRAGEECCVSRDICYFPSEEPAVCPDG